MTDRAAPTIHDMAQRAVRLAQETFDIEAAAILGLKRQLGDGFARAVTAMLQVKGRVVVMGMGKSGHIGRKIAATLASTGTPALFVHTAEAIHGDLGMIKGDDLLIAISHSGESDELVALLPAVRRLGALVVAMTGRRDSTLAQYADITLECAVEKEACPLNLAPTASSTAQMAMGDALAVALLDARGFKAEDFARSHPGGTLGRKLLTLVRDVMRTGDAVPRIGLEAGLADVVREMSRKGLGAVAIVESGGNAVGIFTDGDLRRLVEQGADLRLVTARQVMRTGPKTILEQALAVDAAELMERHRINTVLVVDAAGVLQGALNSNDLMRAKVI